MTAIVYAGLIYYKLIIPYLGAAMTKKFISPLSRILDKMFSYVIVQIVFGLAIIAALVTFIAVDSKGKNKCKSNHAFVNIMLQSCK